MIGRLASVALGLLMVAGAVAGGTNHLSDAEIQGRQLAQQLLEQRPAKNFLQRGELIIRNANGDRTNIPVVCQIIVNPTNWLSIYQASLPDGSREQLIVVHAVNSPNRYSHMDSFGEQPKFVSTGTTMPFANSDFWVADLGLEFFHWPEQKVLKQYEMRRGRSCHVLESTNPHPSANGYSRVISWIDNETLGIVQAEAYDAKGKLLKEFYPKSFKKVNGQWELQEMEIRNDQTGSRTRLEFDLKKQD